jgi:AAA+ ATPase superfamily predicted ATPase
MIGRWWHKDDEIDIVALNEGTKEILFVECKWKHLDHGGASRVIGSLKEKVKRFRWNNEKRKEYFGIMAKKIEDKEKFREIGYQVFDLDDF